MHASSLEGVSLAGKSGGFDSLVISMVAHSGHMPWQLAPTTRLAESVATVISFPDDATGYGKEQIVL